MAKRARASVPLFYSTDVYLAGTYALAVAAMAFGASAGFGCCVLFAFVADLDSALERGAIFDADAHGGDVAVHRAFGSDVNAIAALDVASYFAHDHNFAGLDAGIDFAVAADSDSAFRHGDLAFDASVDVEGFGAADLALDDQSAANGGLIDGGGDGFDWDVRR